MPSATHLTGRWMNSAATIWAFLLAVVILFDVVGRSAFGTPFQGTKEIVSNSIVALAFLQFPLAVQDRTLLRSTFLYDRMPAPARRGVDVIGALLGAAVFAAMAAGGWSDMIIGWRIGEFEGEGAFRIPVYPVRTIIVVLSGICALLFVYNAVSDLFGLRHRETSL